MWIVKLALKKPYTFTVMALLIVILGIVTSVNMAKDIFPSIDIPVVSVIWSYNGLTPSEMEKRIVTISERAMTTTVNDIEHIESQSLNGIGVIRVYFHPGASVDAAVAQVTAVNQTILRVLPTGTTPPLVIRYSASNVPIIQLGLGSSTLPEQQLYDLGLNFVRTQLATVQGASIPLPTGGKVRSIQVDIDPARLQEYGLTPSDVSNAINAQNLTLPSGSAKIGSREYGILLNGGPATPEDLGNLPIREVNGTQVYIRDVAQVRDGFLPQTNIVRQDGTRGALLTILKSGKASTLNVIQRIKAALPRVRAVLPKALQLTPEFDQSLFVKAALYGVVREAFIAAVLTGLMILLFLGTWRTTFVVVISIPLSIFCAILGLAIFGETINIMTLGGFALAVGILVDDATVTIENIDRNHAMGKTLIESILEGAQQIAVPAFVSTLCICVVFVPVFFLEGTAHYLFGPLAMSVIFAMLASYFLSRTVVPTFVHYMLQGQPVMHDQPAAAASHDAKPQPKGDVFWRIHVRFNRHFERFRSAYVKALDWALDHRKRVVVFAFGFAALTLCLTPFLGQDFFPSVDAGQFRLHVSAPPGTRIEETEQIFARVEAVIRQTIPHDELKAILDNIGLPNSGINLAFSDSSTVSAADGEILVSLNPDKHGSTAHYLRILRERLNREFPNCKFFSQSADIVSQILNFGLPAPIDIQVTGRTVAANYAVAQDISARLSKVPGAVDVHVYQVVDAPALNVNVDRNRAEALGLTERDVASNLLISLAGSGQAAPNFWLSPQNGVQYSVVTQVPQYKIDSIEALKATPISGGGKTGVPQLLSNVAEVRRGATQAVVSHYDVQPVFDVYANVDRTDLGSVAKAVDQIIKEENPKMPRGSYIKVRGQVESMRTSFFSLGVGVLFAILLVYLLMVVNFQSWLDPFIIIMALVGAISGIIWALFITRTTINVPSLMGAIMSIGVATANSILVVTFANDQRKEGKDARAAALEAGFTRLRPVLMTALAMIIGMLPMAFGFGEGGEQNAPLGRAVIGGLLFATLATLFLVPVVYATLRKKAAHRPDETIDEEITEARHLHGQ